MFVLSAGTAASGASVLSQTMLLAAQSRRNLQLTLVLPDERPATLVLLLSVARPKVTVCQTSPSCAEVSGTRFFRKKLTRARACDAACAKPCRFTRGALYLHDTGKQKARHCKSPQGSTTTSMLESAETHCTADTKSRECSHKCGLAAAREHNGVALHRCGRILDA